MANTYPGFKMIGVVMLLGYFFNASAQQTHHAVIDSLDKRDTISLDSVSVFGFTATQAANRQAYNITVIDAKKLHNSTLDIAHVLNRVPGARLRESGALGSDYDFSINGFSGKRIKFFLDGVPMESFGASFQINNIPVNLAERVEVYKGVVPVWLGSDALGGAVNIITNSNLRNYLDVSYSYGSFNTHRSTVNAAITSKKGFMFKLNAFQNYSDNDYNITIDAADIHTGKYYPNSTVKRFHDQYHNETAIAHIGFVDQKWADQLLAGLTLGQYYKEIQTGATTESVFGAWHEKGSILMPTLQYKKTDLLIKGLDAAFHANYNLGQVQNIDTVHARYGWLGDSIQYRGKGGEYWYSLYKYRNHDANASATLNYRPDDRQSIALNHTFTHFNRVGHNVVMPSEMDHIPQKSNKNTLGLSYQYRFAKKWDATVFGKYYSQKSNTELLDIDYTRAEDTLYVKQRANRNKWGYGLATSYFLIPALQLKASYEKANRLPDNEELFGDVVYREGNWNLLPESSDNVNAGISYSFPFRKHRFSIAATGTYRKADHFIYDTFNALESKIMAQNLLTVSSAGFESEVRYSYDQLISAGFNITYQNLRDKSDYGSDESLQINTVDKRIPNIPYLFGNADASVHLRNLFGRENQLSIGYNLQYVHAFYLYWEGEGAKETKRTIPKQLSHDAQLTYILKNGRYNLDLECNNLNNAKLYDNFSLQKPGRSFHIKFRYFLNN